MKLAISLEAPRSEFSENFAQKMANAMSIAYCKYGAVKEGYPEKIDAVASAKKRIDLYLNGGQVKGNFEKPGNLRYLVDAANFLMIESMYPRHASANWGGDDSENSPGRIAADGRASENDNRDRSQRDRLHDVARPPQNFTPFKPDGD